VGGGDGIVPWNTVVGSQAWDRAEPLTVFYPGTKFGRNEPFASLRLKAYRRGQQDVEYLALLAQHPGWDNQGLLLNAPRPELIRFMPSLNVTREEIDRMLGGLRLAIAAVR